MLKQGLLFFTISVILSSCNFFSNESNENLGKVHKEYHQNGKLKAICQVSGNKRHGICKYYNEKGKLISTSEFNMNQYHGLTKEYYENGNLKTEVMFLNNKRTGLSKAYYENGNIYIEEEYVNGKLTGLKKKYYENGQLMMENEFKKGKPSINLKEYNEQGEIINSKPEIIIKALDRVAFENKYILKLSLSSKSQRVQYYFGELEDGKYIPAGLEKVSSKNGVGTYEIPVYRGTTIMKKLHIIAKKKTSLNNTQIITRTYNLAVSY